MSSHMMSDFEKFQQLRSEITYEATLISQRIGWFITAQSFLFGSLAVSTDRLNGQLQPLYTSVFYPYIPIISLIICTSIIKLTWESYERALHFRFEIDKLSQLYRNNINEIISKRTKSSAKIGKSITLLIPIMISWVAIILEDASNRISISEFYISIWREILFLQ